MAVTFDSANDTGNYPLNVFTLSHSLGVASGNDRIVIASVFSVGPGPHNFDQMLYNGTAMTELERVSSTIFGRISQNTTFYILDSSLPAGTGSYDLTIEIASGAYGAAVCVASYSGVNQAAPPFASFTDSNSPALSGTVTSNISVISSSGLVVDTWGSETTSGGNVAPGAGQTERTEQMYSTYGLASISEKAYASSGLVSMAQTPSVDYWTYAHILLELADAGGGVVFDNAAIMGANF
jgi:hypothetical protein